MENWKTPNTNELFEAFLQLKSTEEVANFCRDLMTEDEILEFAKRFQIAKALYEGQSQRTIAKNLNLSITTVTRVNKWLKKGMNGYMNILSKENHHHNQKTSLTGL